MAPSIAYMGGPCVEGPSHLLLGLLERHGLLPPHSPPQAPNSQQLHMPPAKSTPPASTPGLGPGTMRLGSPLDRAGLAALHPDMPGCEHVEEQQHQAQGAAWEIFFLSPALPLMRCFEAAAKMLTASPGRVRHLLAKGVAAASKAVRSLIQAATVIQA
ncbi:MAG: hypothetical protein FRX49_12040 [Trebouxia sp. A1-2]|nr:MAG: hypothetical protein FRX49_12040 [Trebouxia sp. A1-2]